MTSSNFQWYVPIVICLDVRLIVCSPPQVQEKLNLPYQNKNQFFAKVDSLPSAPAFVCEQVRLKGNLRDTSRAPIVEVLDFWYRDPVQCTKDLFSNAAFRDNFAYHPRRRYTDQTRKCRIYEEMEDGDWWWTTQVRLHQLRNINPD